MSFLQTVAAFLVALGILIVVHEYGHYLVARLCGVKVLRFSVGFGRPLLSRRGTDGTEWILAAVPFGGYVKMLDEREGPVPAQDLARAFNRQSVWRRIAIVIAGPAFNFLFAIAVYAGMFMVGVPEARPVVDRPPPGSAAALAGFSAGDVVVSVDGRAIETWQAFRWQVLQTALQGGQLRVVRTNNRGHLLDSVLDLSAFSGADADPGLLEKVGLRLHRPPLAPVLGTVVSGSPAERAGLREGDRITHAAGVPIDDWGALVAAVRIHPGRTLILGIDRDGVQRRLTVVPDVVASDGSRIGRIGAAPRVPADHARSILVTVRHGPLESLARAVDKTWDISIFSLRMLGRMLLGEVSWKHLSGPVTIADYAGQSAQHGWLSYLTFLALISISLGVLNLLPIPLLDGGHLMYYSVEIVKGSPVSERVMEVGQRVGLTLLMVMMAFAFYNDLNRLFSG